MAGNHPMKIVLLASFILGTGFMDALPQLRSCFSIRKELVTLISKLLCEEFGEGNGAFHGVFRTSCNCTRLLIILGLVLSSMIKCY